MNGRRFESGFALPLTLIVLALMVVLSTGVSELSTQQLENVRVRKNLWELERQATDLVNEHVFALLTGTHEIGAVVADDGTRIPLDGRDRQLGALHVQVQDAAGLYSLATYSPDTFQALLENWTTDQAALRIAMELGDWIDQDDRRRFAGMELPNYLAEGLPQQPRNAAVRSADELLELPSMDTELYNRVREFVVAGGHANFNVATAPETVVRPVLGLSRAMTARVLSARDSARWGEIERMIDAPGWRFDGLSPFVHRSRYRLIVGDGESQVRIQIALTPYAAGSVFDVVEWRAPDHPRG